MAEQRPGRRSVLEDLRSLTSDIRGKFNINPDAAVSRMSTNEREARDKFIERVAAGKGVEEAVIRKYSGTTKATLWRGFWRAWYTGSDALSSFGAGFVTGSAGAFAEGLISHSQGSQILPKLPKLVNPAVFFGVLGFSSWMGYKYLGWRRNQLDAARIVDRAFAKKESREAILSAIGTPNEKDSLEAIRLKHELPKLWQHTRSYGLRTFFTLAGIGFGSGGLSAQTIKGAEMLTLLFTNKEKLLSYLTVNLPTTGLASLGSATLDMVKGMAELDLWKYFRGRP